MSDPVTRVLPNEIRDLIATFRDATGIERCGIELREDGWAFRFGQDALNRSWSGFTWDELLATLREAAAEAKGTSDVGERSDG